MDMHQSKLYTMLNATGHGCVTGIGTFNKEENFLDKIAHSNPNHFHEFSLTTIAIIFLLFHLSNAVAAYCTKIGKLISQRVWDKYTVSVQVTGSLTERSTEDALYYRLVNWLSRTYPKQFPSGSASITHKQIGSNGKETLTTCPGYGVHYFKFKQQWIRLERIHLSTTFSLQSSCDTMILTTWTAQKPLLDEIIQQAQRMEKCVDIEKINMYRISGYHEEWMPVGSGKNRRPLESVILPDGIGERILADVKSFLDRKEWYVKRDIPHRRGYLFHGPPGCGKTSFIKVIASYLGYDICNFSLSAKGISDDSLVNLLENAPEKSICLIEDIDAAFKSREDPMASTGETNLAFEGRAPNAITFRGLLNALDGVASCEDGRIICMTTNYVDKLDPALIRCGRVDHKVLIDYPKEEQVKRLFERFYDDASPEVTAEFVECVKNLSQSVSVAMIQGLFLMHKDSAEDALKNAKQYFKDEFAIGEIKSEADAKAASSTGLYS